MSMFTNETVEGRVARLAKKKQYRERSKEKIREYYSRPEVRENAKKWRLKNPERVQKYRKQYEERYAERIKESKRRFLTSAKGQAYQKAYWLAHRSNPRTRMTSLVRSSLSRARKNGIAFDLELKHALWLNPPKHCACCGMALDFRVGQGRTNLSPSLDRRDNSKGYTLTNTFVLCWGCNSLKNDATISDLENILAYMRGRVRT